MKWTKAEKAEPVAMKCDRCDKTHGTMVMVSKGTYRHAHHAPVIKPPAVKSNVVERKPRRVPVTRHPETHGVRRHA